MLTKCRAISFSLVFAVLFSSPSQAAVDQGTFCSPSEPLNGAYCLNQTCSPAQLGASMLDKDMQNVVVCLKDASSGRNIWKAMNGTAVTQSVGGGGAVITLYNTAACPAGWTPVFSGQAYAGVVSAGVTGTAATDVFCAPASLGTSGSANVGVNLKSVYYDVGGSDVTMSCIMCSK